MPLRVTRAVLRWTAILAAGRPIHESLNAAVSAGHCIFGDGVGVGVGRINPFYWPGKGNACGFPDGTSITGQCWTNLTGGVWLSFQKPGECKNGAPIGANGAAALPPFPVLHDALLRLLVASTYRGKYRCCSNAGCAWGAVSGMPLKTINRKCILEHGFRRQCNNATLIKDLGCKVRYLHLRDSRVTRHLIQQLRVCN